MKASPSFYGEWDRQSHHFHSALEKHGIVQRKWFTGFSQTLHMVKAIQGGNRGNVSRSLQQLSTHSEYAHGPTVQLREGLCADGADHVHGLVGQQAEPGLCQNQQVLCLLFWLKYSTTQFTILEIGWHLKAFYIYDNNEIQECFSIKVFKNTHKK